MNVGFFGLGPMEIIILVVLGAMVLVIPVIAIVLVLALGRRSRSKEPDEMAALRAENAALRREIDRLEAESATPAAPAENPTGIRKPQ
jgi:cell division protein FtsB